MEEFKEQISRDIANLTRVIETINNLKSNEPSGTMRVSKKKNGFVQYYHRVWDTQKEERMERYLSTKNEIELIKQLAQKQYLHEIVPVLDQELKMLKRIQTQYNPEKKAEVYDKLSTERKSLVQPLFLSAEERFQRWKAQEYKQYDGYQENLRFETDRGEMVRSKSELIIANLLFRERENIHYRYEEEVRLEQTGKIVHPDFSIMSRKKAKVIYWEHAGMVDEPGYADDFVRKVNYYMKEGIMPGENLIITYETSRVPLDIAMVRKLIKMIS